MASILSQTTAEADARLIKVIGDPNEPGFKLFRGWPWIAGQAASGDTIAELIVALNSTTRYTNPKANNKEYAGTFIVGANTALDESERGVEERDCAIVQEITKITTVAELANLGTPIIMSDRETLNYLGFQEGEKYRVYYRYSNIDPASETTCMGLSPTAPTISGFTMVLVSRQFKIETDHTGTFYCVYEGDNWPKTGTTVWATNKLRVQEKDASGKELAETNELTGLNGTTGATAFTAAKTASDASTRVVTFARLIERANGERVVTQEERQVSTGTSTTADLVLKEEVQIDRNPAYCLRVWWRRTSAAMTTLVAVAGGARSAFTYNSVSYTHSGLEVRDNGDSSYDIYQFAKGGFYFTVGRFDNTDEIIESCTQVRVRVGTLAYATQIQIVYRDLFATAVLAAAYAALGTAIFHDEEKKSASAFRPHPNGVEYAGGGKWWGRKVIYQTDWPT